MLRAIRIVEGTKITHDHWETGETFSYDDLLERRIPSMGIPASVNDLLIVDIDAGGKAHKYDGREAWEKFAKESGIPETYTVATANGGFHFYFKLPATLNRSTFKPRGLIFPGVDIVYNGYVIAPPTKGYEAIHGTHADIAEAPITLLRQVLSTPVDVDDLIGAGPESTLEETMSSIHTPLSQQQIDRLRKQIEWSQLNAALSYDQWLRGLISLKAGVHDEEVLEELAILWTRNQSYEDGDEEKALDVLRSRDRFGGIGPGTIFEIIKDVNGGIEEEMPVSLLTKKDIISMAKVNVTVNNKGIGVVCPNESNIASIINIIPQFNLDHLYYDTRMDSYMHHGEQVDEQMITDLITPVLQSSSTGLGFENFRRANVATAVQILMTSRRKDPHLEWLEGLEWDGVERIDTFFSRYVMTEDNGYTRILGKNLWIALAARGIDPGCKMDNIIIIEGKEGIRKSSLVEAIGGEYYMSLATDDKLNSAEALRKMHQSAIVEIPELVGLINREGEAVKAILATSRDRLRSLYSKKAFDRRRGFIFIGTTNSGQYLTENMGERRYWPVKIADSVDGIDLLGVKTDRAQLFAEGVHRYKQGESYWDMPKDCWADEISQRKIKDPLSGPIEDILKGSIATGIQTHWRLDELYTVLNHRELLSRGFTKRIADRLCVALRSIGAVQERVLDNGQRVSKWTIVPNLVDDLI